MKYEVSHNLQNQPHGKCLRHMYKTNRTGGEFISASIYWIPLSQDRCIQPYFFSARCLLNSFDTTSSDRDSHLLKQPVLVLHPHNCFTGLPNVWSRSLLPQFRLWPLFLSIMVTDSTFLLPLCIFEGHHAQMMEWADNKLMKLNKGKCNVRCLRENTFLHQHIWGPATR